uniref:Aspartic peptidase DDI1-type domain-containing protein n=1 Tax=Ditylenchus dipsaci TaxID=166011 RepID=A0A915E3D7_9BILA
MLLTIVYGEQISYIEVSQDMELENFVGLCIIEIPLLSSIPFSKIRLEFGLSDGDAVSIEQVSVRQSQPPTSTTQSQQPSVSSSLQPNIASLVSNLVKNIKVPNAASTAQQDMQKSKSIFDSLGNPARLDVLRSFAPELAEVYEASSTNFEAFHQAYMLHKTDQERKVRLMHDENSEEGQRFIAEQIERANIDFTHQFAMEHMPEAFVPVHMLYIRMKINNHPVMAFVDSGAQVSILSESCAKRCSISRLVDTRFESTAMGVERSRRICQVQVEGHIFPCSFDVMGDRNVDILFGLNVLRRHQCNIDLKKGEEDYRRETEAIDSEDVANALEYSKKQGDEKMQ